MEVPQKKINFSQAANFPKLFVDYISRNQTLKPFYGNFPDLDGFKNQIEEKKFNHRQILVDALRNQYGALAQPANIDLLLSENTFTVTTGHQLNIFTGPLYVIYKIVSTINLAKKLKEAFPKYNFVPVYWMATEDHDFHEISYFNLFGQKHTWETEQEGGVGRMNPSGLLEIIDTLKDKPQVFQDAYKNNPTLSGAVRQYMNELFGAEGLVCIDGDDATLKKAFVDIISDDIFENSAEKIVAETSKNIENLGYKTQIHARNVNFFYLDDNLRERIEKKGEEFEVVNTNIHFSRAELTQIIENSPEKLSPNVVLRPLYQETILPNLAYLGGPSEVCYWLQLKDIFSHYKLTFPILLPRNLALIINDSTTKRLDKLSLNAEELFQEDVILKRNFVEKNSQNTLSLEQEISKISAIYEDILKKAVEVDPTLKAAIESEKVKQIGNIENLEKRIKKAEERKFETSISQILTLKEKLFPGGGLQERTDNFLNFYLNDNKFIEKLYPAFDPLDFRFNIIFV